jgi:hypothetical protein
MVKFLLNSFFFFLSIQVSSQDTTFYNQNWIQVGSHKEASFYKVTHRDDSLVKVRYYFATGQVKFSMDYDLPEMLCPWLNSYGGTAMANSKRMKAG